VGLRAAARPLALALLVVAVAGCGDGESEEEKLAEKQLAASGAPTPVCVDEAPSGTPVPDAFPADFPMPDGSVVYASEERSGGRTIVYAVVDADVKTVLEQLQQGLPDAGFELTEGEVEERDAESSWTGNGYTGRWAIREVAGCTDQTSVTVLAAHS
jgi:uncharacterized lipoprotein